MAAGFLVNHRSMIETARELSALQNELGVDYWEPLRTFVGIDSETDHLPIGAVRALWNPDALKDKETEIASAERRWIKAAREAAKDLIILLEAV